LEGFTEKEAVFSPWKGHRPNRLAPLRFRLTYCPTTSSIGFLATSSSINDGGNAMGLPPFVYKCKMQNSECKIIIYFDDSQKTI
jgi:hypothetical protein